MTKETLKEANRLRQGVGVLCDLVVMLADIKNGCKADNRQYTDSVLEAAISVAELKIRELERLFFEL